MTPAEIRSIRNKATEYAKMFLSNKYHEEYTELYQAYCKNRGVNTNNYLRRDDGNWTHICGGRMIAATTLWRDKQYYILDQDFSEYVMEQGMQEHNELWGFLEDYIKEECE